MTATTPVVYLIPSFIEEEAGHVLPAYIIESIKRCEVFFVENERTARRFLKGLWPAMVIDDYEWYTLHNAEEEVKPQFVKACREGKNIGILSEAGCPGIADPGQLLIKAAQEMDVPVKPLIGPSSILLALMASGLNGQHFQFVGYLPIEAKARTEALKKLESESSKKNCTQIFIETPYRNNALLETLLQTARADTLLCIAASITGSNEFIKTRKIADWKKQKPDLHKKPAIFLLQGFAG